MSSILSWMHTVTLQPCYSKYCMYPNQLCGHVTSGHPRELGQNWKGPDLKKTVDCCLVWVVMGSYGTTHELLLSLDILNIFVQTISSLINTRNSLKQNFILNMKCGFVSYWTIKTLITNKKMGTFWLWSY